MTPTYRHSPESLAALKRIVSAFTQGGGEQAPEAVAEQDCVCGEVHVDPVAGNGLRGPFTFLLGWIQMGGRWRP